MSEFVISKHHWPEEYKQRQGGRHVCNRFAKVFEDGTLFQQRKPFGFIPNTLLIQPANYNGVVLGNRDETYRLICFSWWWQALRGGLRECVHRNSVFKL